MRSRISRRHLLWALALLAVLCTLAWLFEFNLTNDVVYGTGFGALLIASVFWFFDLRHRRQQERVAAASRHPNGPPKNHSADA